MRGFRPPVRGGLRPSRTAQITLTSPLRNNGSQLPKKHAKNMGGVTKGIKTVAAFCPKPNHPSVFIAATILVAVLGAPYLPIIGTVGRRGRHHAVDSPTDWMYGSSPPPSVWTVPPTQNGWGGDLKQTGSFDRAGLRLRQPQYKNPRPMLRPRLRQPLFFEKPRLASRPREGEAQSSPCWPKKT